MITRIYSQAQFSNPGKHGKDGRNTDCDAVGLCLCRFHHPHLGRLEGGALPTISPDLGKPLRSRRFTAPAAADCEAHRAGAMACGEIVPQGSQTLEQHNSLLPYSLSKATSIFVDLPRSAKISSLHGPWLLIRFGCRSRRAATRMRLARRTSLLSHLARGIPSIDRRSVAGFLSLAVPAGARNLE